MLDVKIFTTVKQIEQLTGLDRAGLWAAGFNLYNLDMGFQFDKKISPDDQYWRFYYQMENLGIVPTYCEFNGKHYYLVHHA